MVMDDGIDLGSGFVNGAVDHAFAIGPSSPRVQWVPCLLIEFHEIGELHQRRAS